MSAKNPHKFYEQLLFAPALAYAVSQGYYFGPECEHDFKLEIAKAVNRLISDNLIDNEEVLKQTQDACIELVALMITFVKPQNKWKRLRESSLLKALLSFCPRFPFC